MSTLQPSTPTYPQAVDEPLRYPLLAEADNIQQCRLSAQGPLQASGLRGEMLVNAFENGKPSLPSVPAREPQRVYDGTYFIGFSAARVAHDFNILDLRGH